LYRRVAQVKMFHYTSVLSVLIGTLWLTSTYGSAIPSAKVLEDRQTVYHWVDTWTSMPQLVEQSNLPPAPFTASNAVFNDATLRQTLHLSIGAQNIRIQISNTFGGSDLTIDAASIALPTGGKAGVSSIQAETLKGLTFNNGYESVTIPKGSVAYTDSIDFAVEPQSMLTVSLYLSKGQSGTSITGHPGSRTMSWMQKGGQKVNATTISGASTLHWYFVSGVEAWAPQNTSAFIILGDSITDGRASTDDGNNRWPDDLLARMQTAGLTNIGVNNQAAGGNSVLTGGLGPTLLTRYTRDAINQAGVKYLCIFEGVNDIGSAGTDSGTQTQIGNNLIAAFKQIARDAKKAGIYTIGATITPFGGNGYSYPTREATRQTVNKWILNSGGVFDATVDFDKVVRDPNQASQLASQYDSGDHLHPNVAGYQAMAKAFNITVFS